ncbi:hypothetical protein IKE98_02485 [Candidatus Saccharibacteria bacterium]|nr:hypothetical protein [Candidatus Saccharibacteria bacterium]
MGKRSLLLLFLDSDPRLETQESIKRNKELERELRGEFFIIGYIPVIINISDNGTEKFEPLVELYTALRKNNKQLFNLDMVLFQNNHLCFYEGKKTEFIELRFETTNTNERETAELSERFQTLFPTIKLIFKDLISMWVESPIGLPRYMEAFKKRSIEEAEKAIDDFLIAEELKKPKTNKKPAK